MSQQVSSNVETLFVTTVSQMKDPSIAQARKDFGRWIRAKREKLQLSQDGVADKVGVDRQTIYRIEGGLTGTKRETVIAIATALDLDVDDALVRSGWATTGVNGDEAGLFKGLHRLSPEKQRLVKNAMRAMIDSLAEQEPDTDYIDDETNEG